MDLQKIIPLLTTSNPLDIFKKVVVFNEATATNAERAMVRLGLSSGFMLEGIPLKMDKDGNVVFTSLKNSVSYVHINNVSGIEIMNPETVIEVLTEGSYFQVPADSVPTNLKLKRNLKTTSDQIQNAYGFSLESSAFDEWLVGDAEKFQFQQFLDYLQAVLAIIAEEDIGKEALKELKSISITTSENGIFGNNENGTLVLGVNVKNKFSSNFQNELKEIIESNL